jgi:hypothetical protein
MNRARACRAGLRGKRARLPRTARSSAPDVHTQRMRRADEMEELHTWGVCQLLLKEVREQVFSDPAQAVETAHLAVRLAGHLGNSYHPDWVLELRARAFAHLGNARRVLGELKAADDAFLLADECLARSGADKAGSVGGTGRFPEMALRLIGELAPARHRGPAAGCQALPMRDR